MRNNIVHQGAGELTYEIRGIVDIAEKIKSLGQEIYWENIGDPVANGYQIPEWIKDIVKKAIDNNKTFAYNPTKGLLQTREFLANKRNSKNGVKISADDICFFNGLGDAISEKKPASSARLPLTPPTLRPKPLMLATRISLTTFCRRKIGCPI